MDPYARLAATAAAQGGAFTYRQALDAGLTPGRARTAARRRWVVPERGAYVERSSWDAADRRRRHVLRSAARVLVAADGVVVSHRSAVLVHDLPLLGDPPAEPQLLRRPSAPGHSVGGPGQHVAALADDAVTSVHGVPVTALARTVVDVARTGPVRDGLVVADAALRQGLSGATLEAELAVCRGWPGARTARVVAALADGRAETPLESITRWAVHDLGLPAPETQVEVVAPGGEVVALVDLLWRDLRVVGEADGLGKYDQPGVGRREKLREHALEACGLTVVRNVWDDVWTPVAREAYGRRLRDAFARAAVRPPVVGGDYRTPGLDELRRITAAYDRGRRTS